MKRNKFLGKERGRDRETEIGRKRQRQRKDGSDKAIKEEISRLQK